MEQTFFPVTRREAERSGTQYSSEKNKNAGFPSRLRELRKEKGVSQDTVSKELGVSKSTVGLWETGDTLPDAKSVYDLAVYFEVSTDYLLGLSKSSKPEFHFFAEQTNFHTNTILRLASYSGNHDFIGGRVRLPFEYFVLSPEFDEIINLLRDYLDVTEKQDKSGEIPGLYIKLDEEVCNLSNGNLHVISSTLFSYTVVSRAQQKLKELFERIMEQFKNCGGWGQYMP